MYMYDFCPGPQVIKPFHAKPKHDISTAHKTNAENETFLAFQTLRRCIYHAY